MHWKQTPGTWRTMDLDLKMWRSYGPPKEEEIKVSFPVGSYCRGQGAVGIISKIKTVPTGKKVGLCFTKHSNG